MFFKPVSILVVALCLWSGSVFAQTNVTVLYPVSMAYSKTYTYQVCSAGNRAINHFVIGLPTCITAGDIDSVFTDNILTTGWEINNDPTCYSSYGLKIPTNIEPTKCKVLKFVLKQVRIVTTDFWYSKTANSCLQGGPGNAPSCSILPSATLPVKVELTFNTRDYKLPKGISIDYDNGTEKNKKETAAKKGRVEITYSGYVINKGVPDAVFQ